MSVTTEGLSGFAIGLVEIVVFVGYLAGFWKLLNVITSGFDDHEEIFVHGNWAYLVQRLGITAGQATGMLSSMGLHEPNRWSDVGLLALSGAWVALLLLAVHPVIDRIVGGEVRRPDDARAYELSAGLVKAAFYVAFGFVVNGSLSGSAPDWPTALAATAVFTLLGGALLVGCYFLVDLVNPFPMRAGVREGRLACALEAAGSLVALGLVMRNAIAGDFVGWGPALAGFAATAVAGLAVLYATRWLVDRLVLTHSTMRQVHEADQVPAAALLAAFLPLAALPVTAVVGTVL
ncbi:DUF350 domain-containing protein [Micromonospora sp. NPDC049559]|uniref:DUF350 domain-containing protein n=1 Tax=Micromonospora sp. NPDC049559 TaxID=3155923 RepID=UPI00341529B8